MMLFESGCVWPKLLVDTLILKLIFNSHFWSSKETRFSILPDWLLYCTPSHHRNNNKWVKVVTAIMMILNVNPKTVITTLEEAQMFVNKTVNDPSDDWCTSNNDAHIAIALDHQEFFFCWKSQFNANALASNVVVKVKRKWMRPKRAKCSKTTR